MGLPVDGDQHCTLSRTKSPAVKIDHREMRKELTVGGTLGSGPLASTTTDTDAVDNVALLSLVAQTTSLVGARGARGAVDDVQLTELY